MGQLGGHVLRMASTALGPAGDESGAVLACALTPVQTGGVLACSVERCLPGIIGVLACLAPCLPVH